MIFKVPSNPNHSVSHPQHRPVSIHLLQLVRLRWARLRHSARCRSSQGSAGPACTPLADCTRSPVPGHFAPSQCQALVIAPWFVSPPCTSWATRPHAHSWKRVDAPGRAA